MPTPLSEAITREDQARGYGRSVQDDVEQVDLRHDVADAINSLPDNLRDPRQPPEQYWERYYRQLPPLPANFLPQFPFDNGMMQGGRDENLGAATHQ
ncbi:MAG: hypothetical protein AB7O38_23300 [Pirellulaceae bacterium]